MITAFIFKEDQVETVEVNTDQKIPDNTLWLDVLSPKPEELHWLSQYFIEAPEDNQDLESSSRFFYDSDGLHINSLFLQKSNTKIKNINISFTIRDDLMISIREEDDILFRLFRRYVLQKKVLVSTPFDLFITIFELKIDFISDLIGDIYGVLDDVGGYVMEKDDLDKIFTKVTLQEDINGKIRLSLLDTQRAVKHIMRYHSSKLNNDSVRSLKEVLSDIDSLLPHGQFLFEKINFLLESTIGLNGLQQNKIIKIFSLAAVMFLPPTLIASIYGMNFDNMPELKWNYGYPFALGLMFASALGTYLFFKRKKWL